MPKKSRAAGPNIWGIGAYNGLASRAQEVEGRWAQVENQLQRRADLIPNLVTVARSQAAAEQDLIERLERSRQAYLQAGGIGEKQAAIAEVEAAIGQFQDYVASNPELQTSQAFQNLSYEIAGTENRIAVERMRYNDAVQTYNRSLNQFPQSLIATLSGFDDKPYFQAQTHEVPQIEPLN
ncbi:LemA family protein [Sodalinema gerasimenkoae]|uniref:LemA family protein n=1 Tax=Sodalinema gerasimenkoae TaxID=2862348 RepID=UPI001FEC082D|nr:LemA family protein [Sodalinema gerasimenkoae]